jgi:hypothetical protein
MADVTIYQNLNGEDCVAWTDDQGSHSMLKSAYDAQQATLAANSAPQANSTES